MLKINLLIQSFFQMIFLSSLKKLKLIRESINYRFGFSGELSEIVKNASLIVDECFKEANDLITIILGTSDTLFRFQVEIGDGFGDDIIDTYLSKNDQKTVLNYISACGLST